MSLPAEVSGVILDEINAAKVRKWKTSDFPSATGAPRCEANRYMHSYPSSDDRTWCKPVDIGLPLSREVELGGSGPVKLML